MLEKFKEENKRKKQIIIFTCCCIFLIAGVFFYQSFALFETNERFNTVTGNIENPGDIAFAFYIDDEIVLEAPRKDSGLALDEKSSCTNGVSVSWNVETWNAKLDYSEYKQENTSKVKCNLYFHNAKFSDYVTSCGQNNTSATECMKKYATVDTVNLAYDETTDNNLRYIGASPNNYVWFNEELWRIIGVMENIDDGTGKKESRIKITRSESIGNYSWDSSSTNVNNGYGINEWSQADVNTLLNDYYYNRKDNQICFIGKDNVSTNCNLSDIGIQEETKKMFGKTVWHIGANDSDYTILKASDYYQLERSTNTGKACSGGDNCNDTVPRTVTWLGYIGLQYMSDYGYATSGGKNVSKSQCINTNIYEWNSTNITDCPLNNWLFNPTASQWLLTPYGWHPVIAHSVFHLISNGRASTFNASEALSIFPTLFLNNDIFIKNGSGTKENPYQLSLN